MNTGMPPKRRKKQGNINRQIYNIWKVRDGQTKKSIFISKLFSGSSHSVEGQTIIKSVQKLIECNEKEGAMSLVGKQIADMLDGTRVQTKAPVRWEQV